MDDEHDPIAELERIDAFFDGTEPGEVPIEVLRAAGMEIPDDDGALTDEELAAKLREMVDALFSLGMAFEQTPPQRPRTLSEAGLRRAAGGDAPLV